MNLLRWAIIAGAVGTVLASQVSVDTLCLVCEWGLYKAESFLEANATQAAVVTALDTVCKIIPSGFKSGCDQVIKEYTPYLIDSLLEKETPVVVCTQLGLC